MSRSLLIKLQKTAITVTALLLGLLIAVSVITWANAKQITGALGQSASKVVEIETDENIDPETYEYYKSDFKSIADLRVKTAEKAEEVMGEGAVLLKNDNRALPLDKGSEVSLFSLNSVDPVYGGTGSGNVDTSTAPTLKQAFERNGNMVVNGTLWDYYSSVNNIGSGYKRETASGVVTKNGDVDWNTLMGASGVDGSLSTYGDAAIFVLGRVGGEGGDLLMSGFSTPDDATSGDYLRITPKENSVLEGLKAKKDAGIIKNIIVLINSSNNVSAGFLDDSKYGIDAALWIGTPGTVGFNAVGDLLVGNINPSGRLTSMFWYDNSKNPINANFGAFNYAGSVSGKIEHGPGLPSYNIAGTDSSTYVAYQEGIYLGYRYTETRYEDFVTQRPGTGSFDYNATVKYPFGHGLSYTNFSYGPIAVEKTGSGINTEYKVSVDVTNTGNKAGKEVVQIYVQKPYIVNGVEKAAVELIGFGKTTKELPVGGKEKVVVNVEEKYFASYDADNAKTYTLETGDANKYYLAVGRDCHNAVNNILAAKNYTKSNTADRMTEDGDAALVWNTAFSDSDRLKYQYAEGNRFNQEGQKITNLFDFADINKYEGRASNSITYMSRNNWTDTVKNTREVITWTNQMAKDMSYKMPEDEVLYPHFGQDRKPDEELIQLITLRTYEDGTKVPYDDSVWDEFMDQLLWDEIVGMLKNGMRNSGAINAVGKPGVIDHNGPNGLTQKFNDLSVGVGNRGLAVRKNDPDANSKPMCYPGTPVVASTFNVELAGEMGSMMGEEALWGGYSGLYGPGSNIFRSPYSGRNFEYYSEDPFLSGMVCAFHVNGMQNKGMYVFNKHGILNDQENNRMGICTWANEQSIREIYGRAFEIPITYGDENFSRAKNIMSGFNRMGVIWCGASYELNTALYRNEWGLDGFVCTDMWYKQQDYYMNMVGMMMAGCDLVDGDAPFASLNAYNPTDGYMRSGVVANGVREAAKRIMYTVVHSNGMNGISPNMRLVQVMPPWQILFISLIVTFGVLLLASIGWATVTYLMYKRKGSQ